MDVFAIDRPPRSLISLALGARKTNLSPPGLLKILKRIKGAIRDDGRWYVDPTIVNEIAKARQMLGLDRNKPATSIKSKRYRLR